MSSAKLLGEPQLIFTSYPAYVNPKEGLNHEGPYSRNNSGTSYHPDQIAIHVVYPSSSDTLVRDFVSRLISGTIGYLGFKRSSPPFYSDAKALYYPISNPTLMDYKSMVSIIRDKMERRGSVILAVLPTQINTYYDLKGLCYQHGLASQFIRLDTVNRIVRGSSLQFYLWNLAIAIYAKAGGTPWRVDSALLRYSDCYLGIQTKIQQAGRSEPKAFFVGAADIFNSLGEYVSCAIHQGMSDSLDGLHVDSEFMRQLTLSAVSRYRTNVGDLPQRIVVHRQLEFDRRELEGLEQGLRESGTNCPCVIVHLQEGHHFRGYLTTETDQVVERTTYYPLGKRSVVLFTTGKVEGRYEGGLGTPKPTQINVRTVNSDQERTYKDIEDVCKSVFGFTRLGWNCTRIGLRRPLTVYAADKIGEMAKGGYSNLQYRDVRDLL